MRACLALFIVIPVSFCIFSCGGTSPVETKAKRPKLVEGEMLESQICSHEQFETPAYLRWVSEIHEQPKHHRKQWEFVYILKALHERGMLAPGKKGVGFGVGIEPLPSTMAKYGAEVLATDLGEEDAVKAGWAESGQHLKKLEALNARGICEPEQFRRLVTSQNVDMNAIPKSIVGYDFTWSSCALEHTGSLQSGLDFIENSLKTLKPGGIAVHTTEFNVSSNEETVEVGQSVIYRKKDLEAFAEKLRKQGHEIHINFFYDERDPLDRYIDVPPYSQDNHVRLQLLGYVSTSIGLIIKKARP